MIVRQRLRPKTAASYLGISESNLAKRRMRGDPPPFLKLGRSVAYEATDLDAFLASSRYNSTSEYPSPAVSDRQGVVPPSEAGTADGLIDRAVPPTVLPTRRRSKIGPTYEGMSRLLAEGQPSIGIFASEGGQFIGGHGMTNEARLRTATGFSAVWDGEPIRRVRDGDGVVILSGRRVSMHLMAQPSVADLWLRDQLLFDQGLLSRLLVTAPDSAMGRRLSHDEAPETEPAMARYCARLMSMLEHPLPTVGCRPFELAPRPLTLSAVARRMWIGFADQIERMLGEGGELRAISGMANKLAEHAARIAGVLTLVRDIDAGEIAANEMAAGIELAQHYAAEALRLHGGSQVSAELRHAEQALDWMLRRHPNPVISLVDLYQRGPTAIRDAKRARQAVETLQDHGWLMPVAGGAKIDGVPRREAWRIVRVGP